MPSWMNWLLGSSLIRTQILKFVANIAAKVGVLAAGWILLFLNNHGYSIDQAMSQHITLVGTALAGLLVAIAQVVYDVFTDPKRVNVALHASADTGEVVTPSQAPAITRGEAIMLPSGQSVIIGKPSPPGTTADDLMRAELRK